LKKKSIFATNLQEMSYPQLSHSMIDLSVIVPVYNVERYVRTCIESIYRQGLDENRFELIIVNDGTKDHSMEMIADIIQQHHNIIVINQENQGLSVARNNGLAQAKGEYVLMIDSDDLLIDNSVKILLEKAIETKAEVVTADYLQMSNDEIENFLTDSVQDKKEELIIEELSGEDFLKEEYCRNIWRNLYRNDFLRSYNISFISGIVSQDVPFANECYLKANNCIKAQWPFIIYRWGNPSQTTMFFTLKKAQDLCIAIKTIWSYTKINNLSTISRLKQIDITYAYFYRLISSTTYGHIKELSTQFQVIDYMKQLEPELNFQNGLKQKTWTFMYQNMPHTLIRFYHFFYMVRKMARIH
jgi:glycosyltransferase involved in cell wall biosynthesis